MKFAWDDVSQQHNFSFVRSITDNIDFTLGGQLNIGNRPSGSNWQNPNLQSEFGRFSNLIYTDLKYFF